ncbi:cation:proton antiporter [Streptomyces vinaceus]|uniref:cation:proton antiporter n=1 Tax=Streptomyces vinaceus TaxID=1960 RepID=UPI0037F4BA05
MEVTLIAIVGVVSIVAVAVFSRLLGLAAPLTLVVVGIGLSFVPGVPAYAADPDWVLAGVLPVLLYAAAVNMPVRDFRRDLGSIGGLAVLLVAVTTLGAGWLVHLLIPGLAWPAAFALGAVVSPTDAVAATSVGRRLGLPSRLLTLLEGEGLMNDASALVLLRAAIAAMAASVSVLEVAGTFVVSVAVAAAIGIAVGLVNVRVRALLHDPVLSTAISFVVPFLAFVPAEEMEDSGVLAVVVTGLVTGHLSPRLLRAQDRLGEAMNWRTLAFLLESAVFLLMGFGLKALFDEASAHENGMGAWRAVLYGLTLTGLVIAVRVMFMLPLVAMVRRDESKAATALRPFVDRRRARPAAAGTELRRDEAIGWRGGAVLAWSGMRGAITVAAAQTLPEDTPYRPQLLLMAFVVAATTLLLQGVTLPVVIRAVRVPYDDATRLRKEYGQLLTELTDAANRALEVQAARDDINPELSELVWAHSLVRPAHGGGRRAPIASDHARGAYLRLRLEVTATQRTALRKARSAGVYSSRALSDAQHLLDLEEARLQQVSDRFGRA